jgi:hypothetical protein
MYQDRIIGGRMKIELMFDGVFVWQIAIWICAWAARKLFT